MDDPISRAAAARARAATSRKTVAEAEERRLHAEDRLAAARAELEKALGRSRNAHLDAAQLDTERGDEDADAWHRAAAEEDRRDQEAFPG